MKSTFRLFLLIALIFFATSYWSDCKASEADSLLHLIKIKSSDTVAARHYYRLSVIYRSINVDSSLLYANQCLKLSEKLKYQWGQANAHNSRGYVYYVNSEFEAAIAEFEKYGQLYKEMADPKGEAFALNNIGNVYIEMGRIEEAMNYYQKALTIRQNIKDTLGIAASYNNIGYLYKEQGEYKLASEFFMKALKEFEKADDKNGVGYSYTYLGVVFWRMKNYDLAIKNYTYALSVFEKLNDAGNQAVCHQTLAAVYGEQQKFDEAEASLKKAIEVYIKLNDKRQLALASFDFGELLFRQGKINLAYPQYLNAYQLQKESGNNRSLPTSMIGLAKVLAQQRKFAEAFGYFEDALQMARANKNNEQVKSAYENMAKAYALKQDYNKAYAYLQKYEALNDSLINETTRKQMAELQTRYEADKKEQKLALLSKENAIQQLELSRKNFLIGTIASVFLLGIVLVALLIYRNKARQEVKLQAEINKQQEMAARSIIEAEERERRRIAADLHDGMGQILSAVKMNLSGLGDHMQFPNREEQILYEKTLSLVDESCKEVRTLSHNMMPNVLLKAGLGAAVKDFLDKIDSHRIKINLQTIGLNERIDQNVETVLYRVIQESVNNVIKHSGANHLDIQLIKDEREITVTIEDNGRGFDVNQLPQVEGIGLKNMFSRVEFLKGLVQIDSSPGKGTFIHVEIPLA